MSECHISLFDTPTHLDLDDLDGSPLDVFFAVGIVNPFGPTLTVVAAAREPGEGSALPIIEIVLNPFSQRAQQIGKILLGVSWTPGNNLSPLTERDYGSCPTVILISNQVTDTARLDLGTQIIASHKDRAKGVAQLVKRHFGDPWTRVSEEMRGAVNEVDNQSIAKVARELAKLVLSPEHFKPEFQAFFAAWDGSIENTGLSEDMKPLVMSSDNFKEFFFAKVLPSVWIPQTEEKETPPPPVKIYEKFEIKSAKDLTEILDSHAWMDFTEEKLVFLLRNVLCAYGQQGDTSFIKPLSGIYKKLLSLDVDEDTRLMLENEMVSLVENQRVHPVVFLPFLVEDPSLQIASKAVIDFVSMSDYIDGELYAFTELDYMLENKIPVNRGAVFGGLIAMGDQESIEFARKFRDRLDSAEVSAASRAHTSYPQHKAIQFWLQWAKQLVASRNHEDQKNFGAAASALILTLKHASEKVVSDGKRNYPCHKSDPPIELIRTWSKEDYAQEIAKDLYWLESQEDAPSLFSDVLRNWGLMPNAPVDKQFFHNKPLENLHLKDLGPVQATTDGNGFLSRLFGRKR